jgi:hypothetical protein
MIVKQTPEHAREKGCGEAKDLKSDKKWSNMSCNEEIPI